ncbi:phage scaffolding protein [Clostridioides difficile]|uniref:phage scaffolding protein n=1 Tax=Clostridioides difficile TaxID=1496 RepID=UPI00093BB59B|nr:phage scaffolding protein [Clostridioides difficile]EGT4823287.1 phage scaffold protein [Clostridioides difficile]EGT5247491.1 phage scaffold protein [Clostridioides difficile]MBF9873626.1 phage scaffolding protein [Clostridioides difficile]MBG0097543.1 phage scaffolding protein [Clostridioides difficile]MBG0205252.1 phage scaffolding protein [Clostridioides difficile]
MLEYFKKLLGDEDGQKVYEKLSKDKENKLLLDNIKSPRYVEKTELENANKEIKEYKKQIGDRDKQLNDLQGKVKDNKELSDEIESLKNANKEIKENAEKEIEVLKFNTAFERAIESYNPRNPKALAALINKENVKLIDGNFIGLDEQIKAYQESDSYLFKDKENIKIKIDGKPLDSLGSTTSSVEGSEKKSLGERLAAEKAEASKATETLDSFFK